MKNSKVISLFLCLLGILVVVGAVVSYYMNVVPHDPAFKAKNFLREAQRAQSAEAKHSQIQKAIEVYQGPHLKGLEVLLQLNSTDDIDYLTEKMINDLNREYSDKAFTLKNWIVGGLSTLYIIGTAWAVTSYDEWDKDWQHTYIALVVIWIVAIIVGLLP